MSMLHFYDHPGPASTPPLVIAHGLYGSGKNWGAIARKLAADRRVIAVDMRNHGDSPWSSTHHYTDLGADLVELAESLGTPIDLLGHSMGGKASMMATLTRPDLIRKLIVADIAPVTYSHTQMMYIDAMRGIDLSNLERRSQAEAALRAVIDDPILPSFFTQSLDLKAKRWKLNLDTLAQEMQAILSFPEVTGHFTGPTLFLTGATSSYVLPEHRERIKALFPKAKFAKIPGAGHWLHAEKPAEFEAAVRHFLAA